MCHFQEKALGRSKPFTTFPSRLWEITGASVELKTSFSRSLLAKPHW